MTPRAAGRDRVQENRVRRVATRRGYVVAKSKRRDPLATDYGYWTLTSASTGEVAMTGPIDQVESFLAGGIRPGETTAGPSRFEHPDGPASPAKEQFP